jgi:hypothetical protein
MSKLRIVYADLTIARSFNGRVAGFGPADGGSNPPSAAFLQVSRGKIFENVHAGIAQLVEHLPCKRRVIGSTPIVGSGM